MRNICDDRSSVISLFDKRDSGFEFRKHGAWGKLIVSHIFLSIIYRNCIKIFFIVLTEVQTYFLNTGKDQKSICI